MEFETNTSAAETTTSTAQEATPGDDQQNAATTTPTAIDDGNIDENNNFDNAPEENGNPDNQQSDDEDGNEDDFELTVKYNKQIRTLDRENAGRLAQLGMKYESMTPTLEKISYLAAAQGKNIGDFVNELYEANESMLKERFSEAAGEDEELLSQLINAEHAKQKAAFEKISKREQESLDKAQEDELSKMADEFAKIKKDFPEIKEVKDLPRDVFRLADENGISLYDAKLRYDLQEARAVKKAADKQKAAEKSSVGSTQNKDKAEDGAISAMLKGLYG